VFYLRRPNFGFAAPAGALAIVEAVPSPTADRRLVIARHTNAVYARRFVRGANAGVIGLTAEVPEPHHHEPHRRGQSLVVAAGPAATLDDHSFSGSEMPCDGGNRHGGIAERHPDKVQSFEQWTAITRQAA
jgi:hypothetical protein